MESARLSYIQIEDKEKMLLKDDIKIKELLESATKEQIKELEQKIDENTNKIEKLTGKIDARMNTSALEIVEAVVQSLKSAEDVDQRVFSRFKKIKTKQQKRMITHT